ncbi:Domain of uncharacterised function (DUF397) [Nocardia otitidiscaviarum]|uniref:Domain of uncharacterized function (DUF397) n=1 Tax=Nocardia otitidiscaviarum TaxID=1823 RepID=A0A379JNE7_9NOCA|nr:DUF397 domain-containing protein [Nocardia otitidiscaviarum]SUD49543.1 Domain of uncharacterised function (DUF397) [Nocardia otitidiscaviarum]
MTTDADWRKSSYSNGSGNCVEVGFYADGTIGVRDTKQHGHGPVLRFHPEAWASFVVSTAAGEYDRP